jgi:hypothetical protein
VAEFIGQQTKTIDIVSELLDASLIQSAIVNDTTLFSMFESVRQFSYDQMTNESKNQIHINHYDWTVSYIKLMRLHYTQNQPLYDAGDFHENLCAALTWGLSSPIHYDRLLHLSLSQEDIGQVVDTFVKGKIGSGAFYTHLKIILLIKGWHYF